MLCVCFAFDMFALVLTRPVLYNANFLLTLVLAGCAAGGGGGDNMISRGGALVWLVKLAIYPVSHACLGSYLSSPCCTSPTFCSAFIIADVGVASMLGSVSFSRMLVL